ncbi:hypothetical protein EVAR_59878_1 [Eumeta japonica]|uniref:Uncharacterized protein n=1 Tax=Eumeta variegata TaxID=151549 RepID=A0A4C1XNZ8_EUMVA|nr:hypothetical protein EVAR_59878_1 [Eumeta japonica]
MVYKSNHGPWKPQSLVSDLRKIPLFIVHRSKFLKVFFQDESETIMADKSLPSIFESVEETSAPSMSKALKQKISKKSMKKTDVDLMVDVHFQ